MKEDGIHQSDRENVLRSLQRRDVLTRLDLPVHPERQRRYRMGQSGPHVIAIPCALFIFL